MANAAPVTARLFIATTLAFVGINAEALQQKTTGAQRAAQEEQIQTAVFLRLFQDYCSGRYKPKVLILNVGDPSAIKDPSRSVMDKIHKTLKLPVKPASILKQDVSYLDDGELDRIVGAKAVQLAVRNIEWVDAKHVEVEAEFGKAAYFIESLRYELRLAGSSWIPGEGKTRQHDRVLVQGRTGTHHFKLVLANRPFRPDNHTIRVRTEDGSHEYAIDGRKEIIGTAGSVPREELYKFDVWVDDTKWQIPANLWRDCFEATLEPASKKMAAPKPPGPKWDPWTGSENGGIRAWLSKDGKRLTVRMYGSDGAGSYAVVWRLRSDGKGARKIYYGA